MSGLWPEMEPDSEYSDDGLTDEGRKDQDNLYYQEQEEVVVFPHTKPRTLIRSDQRELSHL